MAGERDNHRGVGSTASIKRLPRRSCPRLPRSSGRVVYGTVRPLEKAEESFLPWAKEPYGCIVMNLHISHSPQGIVKATNDFHRIIDRTLESGGSYFLTYHRWAIRRQLEACHPQLSESRPIVAVKHHTYQPPQAELEADMRIDTTPETLGLCCPQTRDCEGDQTRDKGGSKRPVGQPKCDFCNNSPKKAVRAMLNGTSPPFSVRHLIRTSSQSPWPRARPADWSFPQNSPSPRRW